MNTHWWNADLEMHITKRVLTLEKHLPLWPSGIGIGRSPGETRMSCREVLEVAHEKITECSLNWITQGAPKHPGVELMFDIELSSARVAGDSYPRGRSGSGSEGYGRSIFVSSPSIMP